MDNRPAGIDRLSEIAGGDRWRRRGRCAGQVTMSARGDRFLASLSVPNRIESVRLAASFLLQTALALKVPAARDGLFEVAIVEALNNAFKHRRQDADGSILCEFDLVDRCLKIRVFDDASGQALELALPSAVAPW